MGKDGQPDDKAVIVTFSFGSKGTKGNVYLGEMSAAVQKERASVVITQRDIPDDFFCQFFYVEDFMRESGWHSTLWVANAAKLFCLHNGLPLKAVVIAAPMHLKRAMRDMRKTGFVLIEGVSPQMKMGWSWYEKTSELPWTRSWCRWWSREIPLRMLPWWLYKRLTLD